MENKINVAELLKNCPSGMELDCTMYDDTVFYGITDDQIFPIRIKRVDGGIITLTKYGEYSNCPSCKCVIFPKGKTTWEGFVPPCQFKDGDIVYTRCDDGDEYIFIFENITKNTCVNSYLHLKGDELRIMKVWLTNCDDKYLRLAAEEEKAKLFQAIKDNGYKWNAGTKTLEKDKFDINTLIPFKSRVLVRDNTDESWYPAIWGFLGIIDKDEYPYIVEGGNGFEMCIPYEGNEHLLGTSDDCDEYYKNLV